MLTWLKTRSNQTQTARQLYGSCVAAARNPVLFRDWNVADSLDGRFEMVALHVGLLVRRLTAEGAAGKALGQGVLEQMVAALDDDLRELGISDIRVPKNVQAAASAFYGRLRAYDAALRTGEPEALQDALTRNVPAAASGPVAVKELASYVRALDAGLAAQSGAALALGDVSFSAPNAKT